MKIDSVYLINSFLLNSFKNENFSQVIDTEYCSGRLDHEELVYLDNGITLEVKWGGPFRKEGAYRKGEKVGLVFDNKCLTVLRYEGNKIISQERFIHVKNGYYISEWAFN